MHSGIMDSYTLHPVMLYAEIYFLFCSFPILRFFKFYYSKGTIGLIISHCPVQKSEGEKTMTMCTNTWHRWQIAITHFVTNEGKRKENKTTSSTSVALRTVRSEHYAKSEKQITLREVRNTRKIRNLPALYKQHHKSRILFIQINTTVTRQQAPDLKLSVTTLPFIRIRSSVQKLWLH